MCDGVSGVVSVRLKTEEETFLVQRTAALLEVINDNFEPFG